MSRKLQFDIDYTYCPKGHGDWTFIPTSTLYSDLFWCEKCNYFYEPSIKMIKKGDINKHFNSDRENDLKIRAKFLKWKSGLSYIDMP